MKVLKLLIITSITMVFMGSSFLRESEEVKVQFLIGMVEFSQKSEVRKQRLGRSIKLYAGDKIYTKLESRVELKMFDGTIIKVGENSLFTINKMEKKEESSKMSFGLSFGSIWAKFKKVFSSDSERKISTPTAVVAVRGTEFGVEVDPQTGKTKVKVKEGKVNVTNNRGTNSTDVTGNQQTEFDENGNSSGTENYDSTTDPNAGTSGDGNNNGNSNDSTNVNTNPTDSTRTGGNGGNSGNGSNSTDSTTTGNDRNTGGSGDGTTADTFKPQIQLKKNVNGRFIKERTYVVTGSIFDQTSGDEIFVFVNGESVTKIQKQGSFRHNLNLLEGDNSITVTAQDKAGNVATEVQELFLDTTSPKMQISGGIHPFAFGKSDGTLPPHPPKFSSFKRSIRGFIFDAEPSSGIKRVLINGQEIALKSDNSFSKDIRITIDQYRALKNAGRPYVLNVEVEDLAGNVFRDQSIRIKIR